MVQALHHIKWNRVIIDEAFEVINNNSDQSQKYNIKNFINSILEIDFKIIWLVTGSEFDIGSLK